MPLSKPAKLMFVFAFVVFLVFHQSVAVAQNIEINITSNVGIYNQNQLLDGSVSVMHDIPINTSAILSAFIDTVFIHSVSMSEILQSSSFYNFTTLLLGFNITRFGDMTETTFPQQDFEYQVIATGQCDDTFDAPDTHGTCQVPGFGPCLPTGQDPCTWTVILPTGAGNSFLGDVDATEGLKFLGRSVLNDMPGGGVPPGTHMDTVWYDISWKNSSSVIITTFNTCGGEIHPSGATTDANGWVFAGPLNFNPEADAWIAYIPGGFNDSSLGLSGVNDPHRSLFSGTPIGGLYKDGQYIPYGFGATATWNGTYNESYGKITIWGFDSLATYTVVFLPRNGPRMCAFTDAELNTTSDWNNTMDITGNTSFIDPYFRLFTAEELESSLPAPACGGAACTNQTLYYGTQIINDSNGSIDFVFDYSGNLTVNATTDLEMHEQNYTDTASFINGSDLLFGSNLHSYASGNHILEIKLFDEGYMVANGSLQFFTCTDADSDGFCLEIDDCNDNDNTINPNGNEVCNGADDDCDGVVDEDFAVPGSLIGESCGIENSLCSGYYVCTPNGQDIACSTTYEPFQIPEICGNEIDDDCDGIIDEDNIVINGTVETCGCDSGDNMTCGTNVGVCQSGIRYCTNNEWGITCEGSIGPSTEICNNADDNCDSIVDNLGGGTSVESTSCGCYGSRSPQQEVCNDIDDDCNGAIDDGITCCNAGDVRSCGSSTGLCVTGTQSCISGTWGACTGDTGPTAEVCDGLDNDCDGQVDEICDPDTINQLCNNGILDNGEEDVDCGGPCSRACTPISYFTFLGMAIIVIFVILVVAFLQIRGNF